MVELLSVVNDCCACGISLLQELQQLNLPYSEVTVSQQLVDEYELEKVPALLLLRDKKKIGVLYGYQPAFILEQWISIGVEIGLLKEGQECVSGQELELMSDDELFERVKNIGIYARVSPQHKERIVKAFQKHGFVVAMTGDGVNDAIALKRADIGCAMGIVGSEVSKQAADLILMDDNFSTIVSAVREGRRIRDNILKAIMYLLSCNFGELLLLVVALVLGFDVPLLAIHILWINLVTDSLPALP